jgi:beta-lactamase regulating signal transducer with metallopeptidase domain
MAWSELFYPWLVDSALASLAVLILGSGAVLLCREPIRRLRIIELTLLGCLMVPWLSMVPGYPQLSIGLWNGGAFQQHEIPMAGFAQQAVGQPFPQGIALPLVVDDDSGPAAEESEIVAPAWDLGTWLAAAYLFGIAFGLVWWLVGLLGLARILGTARPAPQRCRRLLADIAGRRSDRVRLLVSSRANQPFACVWWQAVIVLPENLCDDQRAVRWSMAHEWSHIERRHFRAWIAACAARVLFFYQPLVWWLRGQLRLCQDYVADARAGREASQPEDYAEFLTLRAAVGSLCPAIGSLGMGCRKSELYKRIVMLVQHRPIEGRVPRLWGVSAVCIAIVCVAVVAALFTGPRADASGGACEVDDEASTAEDASKTPPSTVQSPSTTRQRATDSSEKAIVTAMRWLANHQLHDGSWSFDHTLCPTCRGQCRNPGTLVESRNAATSLALLPLLGCGQTHLEGKYKTTIRRGLTYLVDHMRVGAQGSALNEHGGNMYAHGLASLALCEAYAMTQDKDLLAPAQAALDFISFAQDPKGGGWRYKPRDKGDTSVSGWQLMALRSGQMAGLRVAPLTVRRASAFLDSVQSDEGAAYGYIEPKHGTEATAAIGLLCRMYLGWKKDNPALQQGVKFLRRHGPSGSNMYYNYYATQVMRHWEGEEWTTWNRQMQDQLVHSQAKQGHEDGSWFTGAGDNGAGPGGRLYCTAMAAMVLEVYYRHLPIYRNNTATKGT